MYSRSLICNHMQITTTTNDLANNVTNLARSKPQRPISCPECNTVVVNHKMMWGAAVTESPAPVAPVVERGRERGREEKQAKMTRPRYKAANHKDGRRRRRDGRRLLLRFRFSWARTTDGRTDARRDCQSRRSEAGKAHPMVALPFTALNNT